MRMCMLLSKTRRDSRMASTTAGAYEETDGVSTECNTPSAYASKGSLNTSSELGVWVVRGCDGWRGVYHPAHRIATLHRTCRLPSSVDLRCLGKGNYP